MLIYHDYHGDSKSSSISTWDQIQISLKCLLPNYQPILSDSLVVSSFLNDPNQKQICTDFKQTCGRLMATMKEFIQEEEDYTDSVNEDLAESWPEYVMKIGGCLRLAHNEGGEEELRVPLAVLPRPWMTESSQNGRVAIHAEDDTTAKGRIATAALEPVEVAETISPPPKPPDLDPAVILGVTLPYTTDRVIEPEKGDVDGNTIPKGTEENI
ncbi:hypothetical protein PIB30_095973 [Stylosanthes scabra]|uniref:Uncharacterized protein n=1 Tax=Stylosanthes scabra TaxID=79078 RepID=A0ABU6XYB7_9FABA|nr:hypothetical protein [Stylosanthes scabra]